MSVEITLRTSEEALRTKLLKMADDVRLAQFITRETTRRKSTEPSYEVTFEMEKDLDFQNVVSMLRILNWPGSH